MKHEWRKHEKNIYLPKTKPQLVEIPAYNFFAIKGQGNPNDEAFAEYIGVLYSVSYAVRMSYKAGIEPDDYYEYTVYPLEGIWDVSDEVKNSDSEEFTKDDLVFNLMIRQPEFVTPDFAQMMIERTKEKKPHEFLDQVEFITIEEGKCVQMMHLGSYDDEPASFHQMEEFCAENNLIRKHKHHREIYLNDARKVAPEKLKTVLRFEVSG